jgi:hypothetical protein
VGAFLGISGPEKHLLCFVLFQDALPQMTQRTSWLCLCVVGQETRGVSYIHIQRICLTDIKQGRSAEKTASVRGIGSKWPNMDLQHAAYAWEVC